MAFVAHPKRSHSSISPSSLCSNYVCQNQHFPTKDICCERPTRQSKSYANPENTHRSEKRHSLLLKPNKTQMPQKLHSVNEFKGEFRSNSDGKTTREDEKSTLKKQSSTYTDYNNNIAAENRVIGRDTRKHFGVNGTSLITNPQEDMKYSQKYPLGVKLPIPELYTEKPLSNVSRNMQRDSNDTSGQSWNQDYNGHDPETHSKEKDIDLETTRENNCRDLVRRRAEIKSNAKETIHDITWASKATDSIKTDSSHQFKINQSFRSSRNNGARVRNHKAQDDYVTFRSGSYQERAESDKLSGNNNNDSANKKDITQNESTGGEVQNSRRVIRVISLKDKEFMSRAKRTKVCEVDESRSSLVRPEETVTANNEGLLLNKLITRREKTQYILARPEVEEVSGRESRMDEFQGEISEQSENRVKVEVKVNLRPQNRATSHNVKSTEKEVSKEISTKVQGHNQDATRTNKTVLKENEISTTLEPKTLEYMKDVKDRVKQDIMPDKLCGLKNQKAVKITVENENRNPSDSVNPVKGKPKITLNSQFHPNDTFRFMPIPDARNSECFNETVQNTVHRNNESFAQAEKINKNTLDFTQLSNESFGDTKTLHEVDKEIMNSFAVAAREKNILDEYLQDVKIEPFITVKREERFEEKLLKRRNRPVTISTLSPEITATQTQFSEVSTYEAQTKDGFTQSEKDMDTIDPPYEDGSEIICEKASSKSVDSSDSEKSDLLKRSYSLKSRLWRFPCHKTLSRSKTFVTDDRKFLKQLSEEVKTILILDARQRKQSADETNRRKTSESVKLQIDTARDLTHSDMSSREAVCPRHLEVIKLETRPLEDKICGNILNKESIDFVDKIHKKELKEESIVKRSKTSSKVGEDSPSENSFFVMAKESSETAESTVVHEFTELISAPITTDCLQYTRDELSNTGSQVVNTDTDHLDYQALNCSSDDMLAKALKGMVIMAASEEYLKQVEAFKRAEYEAIRRRPRKDGKVFLPRRSLHKNSNPESTNLVLTQTNQESEEK